MLRHRPAPTNRTIANCSVLASPTNAQVVHDDASLADSSLLASPSDQRSGGNSARTTRGKRVTQPEGKSTRTTKGNKATLLLPTAKQRASEILEKRKTRLSQAPGLVAAISIEGLERSIPVEDEDESDDEDREEDQYDVMLEKLLCGEEEGRSEKKGGQNASERVGERRR